MRRSVYSKKYGRAESTFTFTREAQGRLILERTHICSPHLVVFIFSYKFGNFPIVGVALDNLFESFSLLIIALKKVFDHLIINNLLVVRTALIFGREPQMIVNAADLLKLNFLFFLL